jgi:mannose-6-phosphate isomerase-like protein (cupin superfamily)
MKRLQLAVICAVAFTCGFEPFAHAQTIKEQSPLQQSRGKFNVVAVNANELEDFPYDAGKVKFIASSDDTGGAYSVVELTEMPGYKTAWHKHNHCEEAFYVLEGTLTITLADKTREFPSGSYILIPRGTPHGQGNFGKSPVRLLTTFTPGGFDRFFKDRVELYKTVKPGGPVFQEKFDGLRAKHKQWVEVLGMWNPRNFETIP